MVRTFVDSGLSVPTAKAMLYFLICFLAVPKLIDWSIWWWMLYFLFCLVVVPKIIDWLKNEQASQIEKIAGELETLKHKVDRMEKSSANSYKWATGAPKSTTSAPLSKNRLFTSLVTQAATPSPDGHKRRLSPLQIDHSGLLDDPLELMVLRDLEALMGTQVEIMASSHADWSSKGVQIRNRHVTQISIKRCGLTTIPESIRHLKHLEWLSFVGNKLTTLPDIFGELPSLKSVDLRDNPLEALPPSLQHMTRPINVNV